MTNKDPYEILGVARGASQQDIKQAYRRLAKRHHPDRNPDDKSAEERFKEVRAAYDVLGDTERRAQYDRFGAGGPAPDIHSWSSGGAPFGGAPYGFDNADLSSIFEQFFSRGGTRRGRRGARPQSLVRGPNLEHSVELSLEEAARGVEREVILTTNGSPDQQERIHFRVPAGIDDGQRVRLRGKGQDGPGGRGDLMVRCTVRRHPVLRRSGDDVLLDLPLTFSEAALGVTVEIPTLDGTTVLKVPPGTSGGTKLRLRDRGIHVKGAKAGGDMYAIVRIQVPDKLSEEAGKTLKKLDKQLDQQPRRGRGWPQ